MTDARELFTKEVDHPVHDDESKTVIDDKKLRGLIYKFLQSQTTILSQDSEDVDFETFAKRFNIWAQQRVGGTWALFRDKYMDNDSLISFVESTYDNNETIREKIDEKWEYKAPKEDEEKKEKPENGSGTDDGGSSSSNDTPSNLKDWEKKDDLPKRDKLSSNGSTDVSNGVSDSDDGSNGSVASDSAALKQYEDSGGSSDSEHSNGDVDEPETFSDDDMGKISNWSNVTGSTDSVKGRKEVPRNQIIVGDSKEVLLNQFPPNCVDGIITSPPYWRARDYEIDDVASWQGGEWEGQLGQEPHPELFIEDLMEVFDACKRVLKPSGSMFVNIDDTYANIPSGHKGRRTMGGDYVDWPVHLGEIADKGLALTPELLVVRMNQAGWMKRQTIIWAKQVLFDDDTAKGNAKPTSATDRHVEKASEYFYHFVLDGDYEYDVDPIRRPHMTEPGKGKHYSDDAKMVQDHAEDVNTGELSRNFDDEDFYHDKGGNLPNVWLINTARSDDDHFAPFPELLVERPIKAMPEDALILDPFAGTGTTCKVASREGRDWVGIEMSEKYAEIARQNTAQTRLA